MTRIVEQDKILWVTIVEQCRQLVPYRKEIVIHTCYNLEPAALRVFQHRAERWHILGWTVKRDKTFVLKLADTDEQSVTGHGGIKPGHRAVSA